MKREVEIILALCYTIYHSILNYRLKLLTSGFTDRCALYYKYALSFLRSENMYFPMRNHSTPQGSSTFMTGQCWKEQELVVCSLKLKPMQDVLFFQSTLITISAHENHPDVTFPTT